MTTSPSVIDEWLHRCIRCGNCKYVFRDYSPSCPSGERFRFETYFASGRLRLAQATKRGLLKWDESLMRPIFACTTCGNCEVQCLAPHREHIVEIIEEMRASAVERLGALPSHARLRDSIANMHNPYNETHHARSLQALHALPDEAELVYFVGCTSNYRETVIRDATISVLKKAKVSFTVVDEFCCGSPLLRTGQRDLVADLASHNIEQFEAAGASRVVTSCSGCYRTMMRDYRSMGVRPSQRVLHASQLFNELLEEGRLVPKKGATMLDVTYHDPCHLGRHMKVYDEPRAVLSALPLELTEMPLIRENAFCCGAGGGVRAAFGEWSLDTARRRISQAASTGASAVVSACPFCVRNLRDAASGSTSVMDLSQVLDNMV
ncbi:MAG: (Fe-S)-binding protein [Candidatus Thorarchaeota archaeon]|nr:(Fe-S)-binding protein [Candidatus Thorarchaeota archaeon]